MHTHHHNSCGFCEEGLPEQHLWVDPPEQYHEAERLARWAAACWAGGAPLPLARGKRPRVPQHNTPDWYEDLRG